MEQISRIGMDTSKQFFQLNFVQKKLKKVTNPILAAQFYQVETYLLIGSPFAIQDALPIIGGHLK